MKTFKTIAVILLSASMMLAFTACGGGSESTVSSGGSSTESSSEEAAKDSQGDAYRVIVKDESGAGVEGVMVQFCSDTACTMGETDADGIAVFADQPEGSYYVHVYSVPEGYAEDSTEYDVPEKYGDVNITLKAAR